MESDLKAFFYDYKYYLFPNDCATLSEVKRKGKFVAKRLLEERCMAPDFIYESIREEDVEIEAESRVFEVSVSLYSAQEYDEILTRHVHRVCPGCENYTDDGRPELSGMHREISLKGTCYVREDSGEAWDLATCVDYFWFHIGSKLNDLAVCIDRNDQKKLNRILNTELKKIFLPFDFYGTVIDGHYTLCFCDWGYSPVMLSVFAMMAQCASVQKAFTEAGWQVLPYRPKGSFRCEAFDGEGVLGRLEETPAGYTVVLYQGKAISENTEKKRVRSAYEYFVSALGEDVVLSVIDGYDFSGDKQGMIPLSHIVRTLSERLGQSDGGEVSFPPTVYYGMNGDAAQYMLPFRERLVEVSTSCMPLSQLSTDASEEEKWWLRLVSYAYLYIPRRVDDENYPAETLLWYIGNMRLVPEPIRSPEETRVSACGIGFGFCEENGYVIDNMVFREKGFFRTLRILAPVLKAYKAKVVVVNESGLMAYDCDYEFTPIDTGRRDI